MTRFAGWSPRAARALIAGVLLLIVIGLFDHGVPQADSFATGGATRSDPALYRAITARVAQGQDYYVAAASEQRARDYPLRPFVTMRLPTLAVLTARIGGEDNALLLLRGLTLAALLALILRLRREAVSLKDWLAPSAIALVSFKLVAQSGLQIWHEPWAAMLLCLALVMRTETRWLQSILCALAAACFRELAAPLLLVMLVAAAFEKRWREAAGWAVATSIFALLLWSHASHVMAQLLPSDPASAGWAGLAGWPFILMMAGASSAFALLPATLIAVALPLALIGWAGQTNPLARRIALFLGGMMGAFMLVARPDNFYWGLLVAPLLPIGLAWAPVAVRDLARAARRQAKAQTQTRLETGLIS
jgi:hypothetical protein